MRYRQERARGGMAPLVLAVVILLALAVPLSINFVRRSRLMGAVTGGTAKVSIPHKVTNLRDVAFTVSWVGERPETGYIRYGTSAASPNQRADDERGASHSGTTHHVSVASLSPNTTYYYDIVIPGGVDDNLGAHYSITTGPSLGVPPGGTVYGQVFRADGVSPAEGCIVYVKLADADGLGSPSTSAEMSYLIRGMDKSYWIFNLNNAREVADTSVGGYFRYSPGGDRLTLYAEGGPEGSATLIVDTGAGLPLGPLVLSSGQAPTQTPAPRPSPSPTPARTPHLTTATPLPSGSPTPIPTPTPIIHVVQPGETLLSIALRYRTTVGAIVQTNSLSNQDYIWVGQRLIIPAAAPPTPTTTLPTPTPQPKVHIVQAGDTLYAIALQYGTSVAAIMQANDLRDQDLIGVGQRLVIPSGSQPPSPTSTPTPTVHIVQAGDTLYSIALRYGTSVAAITQANSLSSSDYIWVGQRLTIP